MSSCDCAWVSDGSLSRMPVSMASRTGSSRFDLVPVPPHCSPTFSPQMQWARHWTSTWRSGVVNTCLCKPASGSCDSYFLRVMWQCSSHASRPLVLFLYLYHAPQHALSSTKQGQGSGINLPARSSEIDLLRMR